MFPPPPPPASLPFASVYETLDVQTGLQAAAVSHSFNVISHMLCCLLKGSGPTHEEEVQEERYPSAVPFLPPLSASTVKYYYQFYAFAVGTIILFGGLLSPALEVNLGLGGTLFMLCSVVSTFNV